MYFAICVSNFCLFLTIIGSKNRQKIAVFSHFFFFFGLRFIIPLPDRVAVWVKDPYERYYNTNSITRRHEMKVVKKTYSYHETTLFGLHLLPKTRVLSTYLDLKINLLPTRAMKCVVHRGSLVIHPHSAINCPLYGAYTFCVVCLCELRSSWRLSYAAMNYPDPLILHCKLHSLSRPISHVNVTQYFLIIIICYYRAQKVLGSWVG
jgi:hypothetical protein